ncbi:MAG: hypothetical protein K2G93_06880 [Rikenella sp.]|nr:hypothetical protein [Rikenella sp.]
MLGNMQELRSGRAAAGAPAGRAMLRIAISFGDKKQQKTQRGRYSVSLKPAMKTSTKHDATLNTPAATAAHKIISCRHKEKSPFS